MATPERTPEAVLDFWLGPLRTAADASRENWQQGMLNWRLGPFARSTENQSFLEAQRAWCEQMHREGLDRFFGDPVWKTPRGRLAKQIVLDQFSRSVYRGTPLAFINDAITGDMARQACENERDIAQYNIIERYWLYLPLAHAEDLTIQELGIEKYTRWSADLIAEVPRERRRINQFVAWSTVKASIEHSEALLVFGRFPHRNAIMRRPHRGGEPRYLADTMRPLWTFTQPPSPDYFALLGALCRLEDGVDESRVTREALAGLLRGADLAPDAPGSPMDVFDLDGGDTVPWPVLYRHLLLPENARTFDILRRTPAVVQLAERDQGSHPERRRPRVATEERKALGDARDRRRRTECDRGRQPITSETAERPRPAVERGRDPSDDAVRLDVRAGPSPDLAPALALVIRNDIRELVRVAAAVDEFADRHRFPPESRFEVQLCIEEILMYIVEHGFDDSGEHDIRLDLELDVEGRNLVISDCRRRRRAGSGFDRISVRRHAGGAGRGRPGPPSGPRIRRRAELPARRRPEPPESEQAHRGADGGREGTHWSRALDPASQRTPKLPRWMPRVVDVEVRRRPWTPRRHDPVSGPEVIVIGAGQAGLATSHFLSGHGVDHVVLERGVLGDSWSERRWDSFSLVTPNWTIRLPGAEYEGPDPDGFMLRDDFVAYLERWANGFRCPVRTGTEATRLGRGSNGRLRVETRAGPLEAPVVVVATGTMQRPRRPRFAERLSSRVEQLDAESYRNPEALAPGAVLVVGSGQTGRADRRRAPGLGPQGAAECRRRRARSAPVPGAGLCGVARELGFFDRTPDMLDSPAQRFRAEVQVSGRDGGRTISLHNFRRDGVRLLGKLTAVDGETMHFADDLRRNMENADRFSRTFQEGVDALVERDGMDAPAADARGARRRAAGWSVVGPPRSLRRPPGRERHHRRLGDRVLLRLLLDRLSRMRRHGVSGHRPRGDRRARPVLHGAQLDGEAQVGAAVRRRRRCAARRRPYRGVPRRPPIDRGAIGHAGSGKQAQGKSLATRKPTLMSWNPTGFLTRLAGRLARGRLSQEPPRIMRCRHAASGSMAEPSDGAPS